MSEPDTILLDVLGENQLEISRSDDVASAANCSDWESGVPHRSSSGNGRRFKSYAWQRPVSQTCATSRRYVCLSMRRIELYVQTKIRQGSISRLYGPDPARVKPTEDQISSTLPIARSCSTTAYGVSTICSFCICIVVPLWKKYVRQLIANDI